MITFHDAYELRYHWLAIKLEDGSVDSTVYGTRAEAIKYQSDERLYCYFPIGNFLSGLSPLDAEILLQVQRYAYDQGFRITDEKTPEIIIPTDFFDKLKAYQKVGVHALRN